MRSLKFAHSFEVVKKLPEPLQPLRKIAYNFWWTWNHEARSLLREIGPELWETVEHNPVELMNRLGDEQIERLLADEIFLAKLGVIEKTLDDYMSAETWFDRKYPGHRENTLVAYFSAEFGLSEALPIYSGGLGVLAGDHLKAASDLGVPLVGVGLLYSRGYFRQSLSPDGWQQERYPQYDFFRLPLTLMSGEDGQPLRIKVEFPENDVQCQVWKAQVGRVELFLLDSNILENEADAQTITDTLYGGDETMRIRQEMILGLGGYRALLALGKKPTVCHMNEGHAAFLALERIRKTMAEENTDFRTARQATVAGNVFTTHTPVPAGFDLFPVDLVERYVSKATGDLGVPFQKIVGLGRFDPADTSERFNMAILAMENANRVNGVSKLHASVSRGMFSRRWPDYPLEEVPIAAITNGVHTMTWMSRRMTELFDRHLGTDWREDPSDPEIWARAAEIPDDQIWEMRENERGDFVRYCRRRLTHTLRLAGSPPLDASHNDVLDPRVLTIGFARRFATYKRATLLLQDRERLKALLFHQDRPIQFVFAGKSHPRDDGGKKLIQDLVHFIRHEGARTRMVFLEDYDMSVARRMIQGVDLWLNNPRRPLEASGTSGMKVVPNGGLNASVLDGWWAEGYRPGLGWAVGDGNDNADEGYQDWLDSRSLYNLLETEIAPTFYYRVDGGVPSSWVEMIKRSWRDLSPYFSTLRMVREYTSRFYVPSDESYQRMSANGLSRAKDALAWRDRLRSAWKGVRIVSVTDDAKRSVPLGQRVKVRTLVDLGPLNVEEVRVQAVVGQVSTNRELSNLEISDLEPAGKEGQAHVFEGQVATTDPGHRGYVVRVVPYHEDLDVAAEVGLVAYEPQP
ncbi:MAG: alpha-glucan family phosphorylase [Fimbriimonadaceae bacterium]|nr:alpha-glucan family phosphorylase [Fimbriimonadaceae bacterium]QYK55274.1 MAG: alpha-glucan family phosphorylase [Fimbriimonadaceae bacterium]